MLAIENLKREILVSKWELIKKDELLNKFNIILEQFVCNGELKLVSCDNDTFAITIFKMLEVLQELKK